MTEARTGKRFPLQLPVTIRQHAVAAEAMSANMSGAGVYVVTDAALSLGSLIEFDITLPGSTIGTEADVKVQCKGRVVRVDESNGRSGFGCVIDHYKFVRSGKP